jgi:hypothetical protein
MEEKRFCFYLRITSPKMKERQKELKKTEVRFTKTKATYQIPHQIMPLEFK